MRPTAVPVKIALVAIIAIPGLHCPPARAAYPRPVTARHAMVVTAAADATRVGIRILKDGGNAIDAAVAVGFALTVVHPEAGNLGGGGFMMVHLKSGRNVAIDFRETAPGAATRTMYLDRTGRVIPGASTVGYRAVGVPGTVAGLDLAEHQFGRLSWRQVIEPARLLALHGARVTYSTADSLSDPDTQKTLRQFDASRRIFFPDNRPPREGEWLKMPDLAVTLGRLQHFGARDFYHGRIAHAIASDMKRHGGLITLEDLAHYRAVLRDPVEGNYRGCRVVSMPLPSSGGIALVEMLNILKRYDLHSMGFGSAAAIHTMVEAMRRAFADRSRYGGDPAFVHVPVARLISDSYAAARARTILPDRASPANAVGPGVIPGHEGTQTTHFCVVDSDGNAVSCTYTLNALFGGGATVPGTGILLNDEMDDFASAPNTPNMFGLVQGESNAIAPGKRPLSSMTPTFVFRGGRLVLVTGSPGGPTIINTVLEIIVNTLDFGMDAAAATDAPRFHQQWLPETVRLESQGFSPDTIRLLSAMGYRFDRRGHIGDAQTIAIDPATGIRYGASDIRWSGAATGY